MLVEFSVENYRSIAERQTLSMVASKERKLLDSNTFKLSGENLRLLKSAVFYGANASGKTNILKALNALKQIVITSANQRQVNDKLEVEPFRLDSEWSQKQTSFEVIFIQEGIRYQYYLSLDQNRIYEESLIAYPKGLAQCWYERKYISQEDKYDWHFGAKLKGQKSIIKNFVRPNSLFLSHATQNNHAQLTPIFNWFNTHLYILDFPGSYMNFSESFTAYLCAKQPIYYKHIKQFMAAADIDIHSIQIKTQDLNPTIEVTTNKNNKDVDNFQQLINILLDFGMIEQRSPYLGPNMEAKNKKNLQYYFISMLRKMNDSDELIEFNLRDESTGTQRLFSIIGIYMNAFVHGKLIIIDELGKSLHPALSLILADTFNQEHNDQGAQLIFTTHDTTLLDRTIFRRDQIWFTEKNKNRATELYSLSEFKPVKNESLQKGYLQGRYGAIPFIGKFQF